MKYAKNELMPKRYPDNKPQSDNDFLCFDKENGWVGYSYDFENEKFPAVDEYVEWFIDIPDAPDEVKPLEYPENKPNEDGEYVVHVTEWAVNGHILPDEWTVVGWSDNDWNSMRMRVDYFIDIPLEEESESVSLLLEITPENITQVKVTYGNGGITKTFSPSYGAEKTIKKIAELFGYEAIVTKQEPEIAPCPYCKNEMKREDFDWNTDDNFHTTYEIKCAGCGLGGLVCDSLVEAIDAWNALPRNMSKG